MINSKINMKNICLVTWYNSLNYGTCLQSYALVRVLKDWGFNAYIPETFRFFYYDFFNHPIITIKKIFEILMNKYTNKSQETLFEKEYNLRQKRINDFAYKYNKIYPIKSYSDYVNMQKFSDIYLTGSDQIWNPYIIREAFLLTFVKDNKRKSAYSSSIGVAKIPDSKRKLYKRALSQFYKIGVREKSAQNELSKLLNRDIEHVLDPVYLLNKEDWESLLMPNKDFDYSNNYLLCYFVGANKNWQKDVRFFSENNNVSVYTITSEARIAPDFGNVFCDLGVEDFLLAIHNAKYVITDSFHAIAFCIIFQKNFVVYRRFKDNDNESQNSRIYDILKLFGLENRLVSSYEDLNILGQSINYENVNIILEHERQKSLNFLMEAIT